MSKVAFQIGRTSNRKRTQSIEGWINDLKVEWSDDCGKWLTTIKDKNLYNTMWYMYITELESGDAIKMKVTTFGKGYGKDVELTLESIYVCDEDLEVKEIYMKDVGLKNYPIIKGRVTEVALVTDDDKRKQDIEDELSEGF